MKLSDRFACGSAALLLCVLSSGRPAPAAAGDKPAEPVLRVYDVGDLIRVAPDQPLGGSVVPPTNLNGGKSSGFSGGLFGGGKSLSGGKDSAAKQDAESLASTLLCTLLTQEIAPDTWKENGGAVGSIRPIGNMLLIRQTPENHKQIAELLESFRKYDEGSKSVKVQADWLLLEPAELAQILKPEAAGTARWEIDPAAVRKLDPKSLYAHGRIACSGGQTVHLLSGRVRTLIQTLDATVGTATSAYQPEVAQVLSGAALQVTPHLGGESAVVDVQAFVGAMGESGEPYRISLHDTASVAATRPSDFNTTTQSDSTASVDRLNARGQELCTTARVPLGKMVLVGGMTYEPDAKGAQAAAPAKGAKPAGGDDVRAAEGRQIYLVLRVDAE